MAIELSQNVIDRIHSGLEDLIPLADVSLPELRPYQINGDYTKFIASTPVFPIMETEVYLSLLILAAEEELKGYPMEASNEIS